METTRSSRRYFLNESISLKCASKEYDFILKSVNPKCLRCLQRRAIIGT